MSTNLFKSDSIIDSSETVKEYVEWATNRGINGGTCISPHIRTVTGFCNICNFFEYCTVSSKKKSKL